MDLNIDKFFNKKIDQSRIYLDNTSEKWGIPIEQKTYTERIGYDKKLFGIGITQHNWDKKQDSVYTFYDFFDNDLFRNKDVQEMLNIEKNEKLCRYLSNTTIVSNMIPLCIINEKEGYIKYMENNDIEISSMDDIDYLTFGNKEPLEHLRLLKN